MAPSSFLVFELQASSSNGVDSELGLWIEVEKDPSRYGTDRENESGASTRMRMRVWEASCHGASVNLDAKVAHINKVPSTSEFRFGGCWNSKVKHRV